MRLENYQLDYKNPLVNKYTHDFVGVAELFNYHPYDISSFQQRAKIMPKKYTMDREKLVATLQDYNLSIGCGQKTLANIEKLKSQDALMIITGQQPGVFTGPLYTLYKAITTIKIAAEMSKQLAQPVVPVFWVGGEDHDFGEISHLDILTSGNHIARIRLEKTPDKKISVGQIAITEDAFELIDKLNDNTANSEFKSEIIAQLKRLAEESANLGDWFARIMNWLLGEYGLIMVNPFSGNLKKMGREIYKKFILHHDEINQAFKAGQERVRKLGFTPQVEKEDNNTHLYFHVNQERLSILSDGNRFYTRGNQLTWTQEELLQIIEEKPDLISANVVLKPVFQDYVFPLLSYVAGPGEIGYYALYKDIYLIVGMEMPIISPRAHMTLIEKNVSRFMENYQLDFNDVWQNLDERMELLLTAADDIGIEQLFADFKKKFTDEYSSIITKIALMDNNLANLGAENTRRIISQMEHLESKARQQLRKKNEDIINQFAKIRYNLVPRGNLQEREYNLFPYLIKYGIGMVKDIIDLPIMENVDHKLVYI